MTVLKFKLPKAIDFYDDPDYIDRSHRYHNYDAEEINVMTFDCLQLIISKGERAEIDVMSTKNKDHQSRITKNIPMSTYKAYTSDKHPLIFIDEEKDTARSSVGPLVDEGILLPTGDAEVIGSLSYHLYEVNTKMLNSLVRL